MPQNVAQKLIVSHLLGDRMEPGAEIALRIDQTLTQDATGTLVMLELEAMGLERVKTQLSVQYVDHNVIQADYRNPDDHLFLRSACRRLGVWFSRAGNGVSHPVHMERFGKPGKTLLGADSHSCSAGSIAMLAIGAGGLEVALAMAGEPYLIKMPLIWGVRLTGSLPPWVSAKDVILEMLRRHSVRGGVGRIIEYYGPGLEHLTAMDRHVIANMGAELGATTTVFPSDQQLRRFLKAQKRESDWVEILPDPGANYDIHEEIDLSALEPLIAMPSSPDNVVPVSTQAGREIYQAYIGSSANPGYRDFAIAAAIVRGRQVHDRVSFDVNPASRQILENLMHDGHIQELVHAGARLHQAGCNGCIGMGQAPATKTISLRTVPRNFPGRSGTKEDQVCLVSPETAAASALKGVITDPRTLGIDYPVVQEPEQPLINTQMLFPPLPVAEARTVQIEKGPNIGAFPTFAPLPQNLRLPVLLKMGDNISTDEIMPAGARVLPFRSNIPKISDFCFEMIDPNYPKRAMEVRERDGHIVVGGFNYGQGSSREHAAIAPRYLGLRAVLAKGFARIHRQNLINSGVIPLVFADETDYDRVEPGDIIALLELQCLATQASIPARNITKGEEYEAVHYLSPRQAELVLQGGLINWMKARLERREDIGLQFAANE